ncbi:MAG: WxcM-like domain-containing protein [Patescibacteria group bacterium]
MDIPREKLEVKEDARGKLVEAFKIPDAGQVFYMTTHPGATRGNHYHTRKVERFLVIQGTGKIRMRHRATGEIKEFIVSGEAPEIIDMIMPWTHNIQNIGNEDMVMLVWVNEVFDPNDPDTYSEEV